MYDVCVSNIYQYKYVMRRFPDKLRDVVAVNTI